MKETHDCGCETTMDADNVVRFSRICELHKDDGSGQMEMGLQHRGYARREDDIDMSRCPRCGADVVICDECPNVIIGKAICVIGDDGASAHFCSTRCWRARNAKRKGMMG